MRKRASSLAGRTPRSSTVWSFQAGPWRSTRPRRPPGSARRKYGNQKTADGYDSKRERNYAMRLRSLMSARADRERVLGWDEQVVYELIPKQEGERSVTYRADFVVRYADGRTEVVDVKSPVTRRLPAYVIKRKLMLW